MALQPGTYNEGGEGDYKADDQPPSYDSVLLGDITEDDQVYFISEWKDYYLYESQKDHNYKLKGIQAYRACTNQRAYEFQNHHNSELAYPP